MVSSHACLASTNSTDMLTRLSFYRDQDYSDQISTFRGRGLDKWQSFVVDSNKLFFKFSSSADSNYWGFKFTVKPLDWRLDDVQVSLVCHTILRALTLTMVD